MDLDYAKLGFKAGIEIHQELNTKKLFCACDTSLNEANLVSETTRKLRAVAGETGEIDLASAYEQLRNRAFVYHGYKNEACLVDLDEEPPHSVCDEAFHIGLSVAKLFKLKIPDIICVMRKTVTDGSAVSGFQRTILMGTEGKDSYIETTKGKVKIMQLNLEEDSSKIEKKENNTVFYSLSRLGIPLLEIGTDASLKDPEHVKETALEIGTILRSFNVKRGIGTIRQDVNVSIKEGARVEVKGWQDLRLLEDLVKNEVMRQFNLIELKKELEKRGLKKFKKESKEVTDIFLKTESKIISDILSKGGKAYSLVLPKFSGLLKKEVCPGKTFGRELSEYAKAYGTKGMIHTDEDLKKYKLEAEFDILKKELKAGEEDLIILICEEEETAKKAIDSVYERAIYCLVGVPEETRIPNHLDATSSYARPLPGAHRLYPETDCMNIPVTKKMLDKIKLPELINDKLERYAKEYSLNKDIAKELVREGYAFEEYVKKYKHIEPKFIVHTLVESPKEIKKRYNKEIDSEKYADEIFAKLNHNEISKDAVFEILIEIAHQRKVDYLKYKVLSDKELEVEIKKIAVENKGMPLNALIGKAMEKLRGKADGKKVVELLKGNT
jgi:glutamyl-tRNA(Gln) amidotransferase subunit E